MSVSRCWDRHSGARHFLIADPFSLLTTCSALQVDRTPRQQPRVVIMGQRPMVQPCLHIKKTDQRDRGMTHQF